MSEYIHLIGAETVQNAANSMRSSADTMQSAANSISESVYTLLRGLDEFATRMENLKEQENKGGSDVTK